MSTTSFIPYGRQQIDQDDIRAVVSVLESDWLTQGPVVPKFEAAMAETCQAKHAIAVSNATSALHLACLALGVGYGDLVWTSPISFVASANCALYCGAEVDFVDIDPLTWNLSPERLKEKLIKARNAGRLPKVVIPVHLCGRPCDMESIHQLSKEFGFRIIEDASHAVGASYKGHPIGSCTYSDITVFSFHPVKIITSAEGGMALTNDPALAQHLSLLRSHGVNRETQQMTRPDEGSWYYEQIELGWNYRMTELQAALGLSQSQKMSAFVEIRKKLARRYDNHLAALPVQLPASEQESSSSQHLYVVRVPSAHRKSIFESMRSKDIGVNVHYLPIYQHPYFRQRLTAKVDCPQAENYYSEAISLPLHPGMTLTQQDHICDVLSRLVLGLLAEQSSHPSTRQSNDHCNV